MTRQQIRNLVKWVDSGHVKLCTIISREVGVKTVIVLEWELRVVFVDISVG